MFKLFAKGLFSLLLCSVISACTYSYSVPETPPTETSIPTPTSTQTPPITPSPTASLTPYPTLSANKPYLMMQQDVHTFVIYDALGLGRKVVKLPPEGHIAGSILRQSIVSPDGQWLAFYVGNFKSSGIPESLPITLNILNLNDGTIRKIADVVTEGYTNRLMQLADHLKARYPDMYKPVDNQDWADNAVIAAFQWSIESVSWSPDSRQLAFAAQLDGLSSDVYLYDLESGLFKQVENSEQSVSSIEWSPDGQYIVFENSVPGNVYTGSSLYAVKPGKQAINNPAQLYQQTWLFVGEWISPELLLVADGTDTAGNFNLQVLNIRTGQLRMLWPKSVGSYATDFSNKIIAVNTGEFADPKDYGLYFITFSGRQTKVLSGLYWAGLYFRGGETHRFLMQGMGESSTNPTFPLMGELIAIGMDGKPEILGKFDYDKISISPDGSWLLTFDDKQLYLYDSHDHLAQTFPIIGINGVIWRTDSQGIFYSTNEGLYILPIPNGKPSLVDQCGQFGCSLRDAVWLP